MSGWDQQYDIDELNEDILHKERGIPMDRISLNTAANIVTAVCAVLITFKVY